MDDMFCYQCEQTAKGVACTTKGVCGKTADISNLQDDMTGALVALAVATKNKDIDEATYHIMLEGMFTAITNVSFYDVTLKDLIGRIDAITLSYGGKLHIYTMKEVWSDNEDIRSLKSLILLGLRGMGAYAYHAWVLGYKDKEVNDFFFTAMRAIGGKGSVDELLPLVLETGKVNLACMKLLDEANTQTYGDPTPIEVPLMIEKGPFIVVSGHDLYDLYQLLIQTQGKGINIYTHGEMLPAHGYPKLREFDHLKGNFGTAWQNQQKEFIDLPGAVLFTTNCLMPPKENYKDRIFTTEVVSYPELVHIGEDKDFTPVIEKALSLGGYSEDEVTVLSGGPMMGKAMPNDTFVITAATNAITVLKPEKYPDMACLRCGSCTDHCPAAIQPVRINEFERAKDVDALNRLSALDCIECGLCT
ncbi:MAG: hydroxylamine reductase, partial [Spirochaetia bacterium]|nr:hydroxylamine reductase [Spirochaetia bacterium]